VKIGVVDERLTRELRRAVLRPELPQGAALPGDELDDGVHFGALDDDRTVLCTCFVYPDPCPWRPEVMGSWHLRQMATVEGARGRGIGAAVLAAAVDYALDQGATLVWCNARERAVPFYARHGFIGHGELFTDERHTIPHLRMYRELSSGLSSSTN
jgi:GNAT superfamily N-acetyltransferase